MIQLPLTKGFVALVDDVDAHLAAFKWNARRAGAHLVYAQRSCGPSTISLHREITGAAPGQFVDHINGNGLDNRSSNLRLCTAGGNSRNRTRKRAGVSSTFKGVHWHSRDRKWIARITPPGLPLLALGYFDSEVEAARAYDTAAVLYFGEFAATNAAAGRL